MVRMGLNDIIFWFKVKLRYFSNCQINTDDDRKENDTLWIDFENTICKNLQSQPIRGKFLLLISRSDLRNLGFELLVHQIILEQSIESLVKKYPIPIHEQ